MIKLKFTALILAVFVLAQPLCCLADEVNATPELNIECCLLESETLSVVIHTNINTANAKFSAMLDSFDLGVCTAENYELQGGGTSYLVLADIAGADESTIAKILELATAAASLVGKNDNIAIMPLGEKLNQNAFTSAKPAINAQLALIKPLENETSSLYQGIAEAASLMNSTIGVKASKKLIIISDGKNNDVAGITLEETTKCIESVGVSVCTIGLLDAKSTNTAELSALGSLARCSVGGKDYVLDGAEGSLEKLCASVRALDSDCFALRYDLTDIAVESVYSNLLVSASVTGVELKSDINVDMRVLLSERRENEATPVPTEAPVATPILPTSIIQSEAPAQVSPVEGIDADMTKAISDKTVAWAIVDGVAVIGVLILVAVIAKRRRRTVSDEDDDVSDGPACHMTLTRLTGGRFSYKETFTASLTVGRSAREAQLVLLDEETVAPTHCRIDLSGNRLSVISLDNGYDVMVNGETVGTRQKLLLRQGDVLQLGELKLKLRWYMR